MRSDELSWGNRGEEALFAVFKLQRENERVVNLVAAMLGNVSPNLRRVWFEFQPDEIHLHFLLERDSGSDREAVHETASEFNDLE